MKLSTNEPTTMLPTGIEIDYPFGVNVPTLVYYWFAKLCRTSHELVQIETTYAEAYESMRNCCKYIATRPCQGTEDELPIQYNARHDAFMGNAEKLNALYVQLVELRELNHIAWVEYHELMEKHCARP
jgi:hypothetical protein